jgi:hypothetical protein
MLFRQAYIEYEILFGKFPVPEVFGTIFAVGDSDSRPTLALVASDLNDDERNAFSQLFNEACNVALRMVGRHQGELSASTLAWTFRQAVLYAEGKPSAVCDHMPERSQTERRGTGQVLYKQRTIFDMLNDAENTPTCDGNSPDDEESRISALRATVERCIPNFAKAVAGAVAQSSDTGGDKIMCHQDSFAAQYDEAEYALLGMAVKYAGLYGVTVTIIGKNQETF